MTLYSTEPSKSELQEILEAVPLGVVYFRQDGSVEVANTAARHMLLPLVGRCSFLNIFDTLSVICPNLAGTVAAHSPLVGIVLDQQQILGRVGTQNLVLTISVKRIRQDGFVATLKDVSRLTEMLSFAFAAADLLIDVDEDGVVGWAGGAFASLLGIEAEDVVGKHVDSLVAPQYRAMMRRALMMIGGRGRLAPMAMRLANAAQARCVVSGLTSGEANKRFLVTIGPAPEAHAATTTSLKSLAEFSVEAAGWLRQGESGQLALLDVKGWDKAVARLSPEQLGQLNARIAVLATEGDSSVVGQLSHGRFGVLGGGEADLAHLSRAIEDLVRHTTAGAQIRVDEMRVDLDRGGLDIKQSLQALRLALSRFEANGSASAGLADGLTGIIEHAARQRRALANTIANGRFKLAYQPIVSVIDRQVHHYEALLRPISDTAHAAANTGEFVALVEAVGLSQALDCAVLQRSTNALRQSGHVIAVNISGDSIVDPAFTKRLLETAQTAPQGRLVIELTETAEIRDLPLAAAQLQLIRKAHIPICLDDFGAGSASFRYVRDLEIDFVKIDGSYIRGIQHSEQGRSIVASMCDLASSVGAQTIAEMVETKEEAELLVQLGISFGQGHLYGKPGNLLYAHNASLETARWRY